MTDTTRPISQKVSVADPGAPSHVLKPNADGSINVAGGTGGDLATEATALDILAAAKSASTVNVSQDTATIMVGDVELTPKFAAIAASTSGDANVLVAAVPGKKIRVVAYMMTGAGAVNAKFSSDPTGHPAYITGLHYIASAGQGAAPAFCPVGMFETVAGEALGLYLSAAVAVGGWLVFIEV